MIHLFRLLVGTIGGAFMGAAVHQWKYGVSMFSGDINQYYSGVTVIAWMICGFVITWLIAELL